MCTTKPPPLVAPPSLTSFVGARLSRKRRCFKATDSTSSTGSNPCDLTSGSASVPGLAFPANVKHRPVSQAVSAATAAAIARHAAAAAAGPGAEGGMGRQRRSSSYGHVFDAISLVAIVSSLLFHLVLFTPIPSTIGVFPFLLARITFVSSQNKSSSHRRTQLTNTKKHHHQKGQISSLALFIQYIRFLQQSRHH